MESNEASVFSPPYMPFKTFLSYIERLGEKPLPPKIDRSMMGTKSGTEQANLLGAFKGFGLIDEEQAVQDRLIALAEADADTRKTLVGQLLRSYYPAQFTVSDGNGTPEQLLKSFDNFEVKLEGDTRRKAMTFFLHAARYAGLELSPHFPITRMGSGSPAAPRGKRTARRKPPGQPDPNKGGSGATSGETKVISLGDAGKVTVTVDVRWLELPDETFSSLRQAIRDLEALGADGMDADDAAEDEEVEV